MGDTGGVPNISHSTHGQLWPSGNVHFWQLFAFYIWHSLGFSGLVWQYSL